MSAERAAQTTASSETCEIAVPGDTVRRRQATPEDASFQLALFCAHTTGALRLGGLPETMIENLLAMQYRSRANSYRNQFPEARWSIVESADGPIGELIEHDEADAIYVVDIALLPDQQRRGIGSALIRALMADGAARGGVRALVLVSNEASRRMFRGLGFAETWDDGAAHVELRWRPPAARA